MAFSRPTDEADSFDAQKAVLDEALDIYFARNAVHEDLWKEDGALGNSQHLKSKFLRVQAQLHTGNPNLDQTVDDALDAINYLAMLIRNARDGRIESEI